MTSLSFTVTNLVKHGYMFSTIRRNLSQAANAFKILSFSEAKKEIETDKTVVLDVREKLELTNDGRISNNVLNVPVGEVPKAFVMDDDEFARKYGSPKPKPTEDIIIHCKKGIRAELSAKVLTQLGYKNIRIYSGIEDWAANGGQLLK